MARRRIDECAEDGRHKARRAAANEVEMWLLDYAESHDLSNIDMLCILGRASETYLRYADRDDELGRTGYKHRLAGE